MESSLQGNGFQLRWGLTAPKIIDVATPFLGNILAILDNRSGGDNPQKQEYTNQHANLDNGVGDDIGYGNIVKHTPPP